MENAHSLESTHRGHFILKFIPYLVFGLVLYLFYQFVIVGSISLAYHTTLVMRAQALNHALSAYANDPANNYGYPDTRSSTEAFQVLVNQGYLQDPQLVYVPRDPGMSVATEGDAHRISLRPDNVGWDLTAPVTSASKPELPILYFSGYHAGFYPGIPTQPLPRNKEEALKPQTWKEWGASFFSARVDYTQEGTVVGYKNLSCSWHAAAKDGSIPDFLAPGFYPIRDYHQITPTGILPAQKPIAVSSTN